MVTTAQLALTQSPISSLIPSVGNTVTVKLDDSNYITWNFQFDLLLEGNGIMGFLDGSIPCPEKYMTTEDGPVINRDVITDAYKVWKIHDKALMTLITATLSPAALSSVIGCQSSKEMWLNLKERFSSMTRTSIVQMKIDLQNIKKGAESMDLYLQRIKDCRDKLAAVGVAIPDEDIVIVALRGLPPEYNTIKAVIRGRENLVSLQELRSQLKAEESTLEEGLKQPLMAAMYANRSGSIHEFGGSSGTKSSAGNYDTGSSFCQVPQMPQLAPMPNMAPVHQLPQLPQFQALSLQAPHGPYAFVSQVGSGTYNNFRGQNFKYKGKGKKFHSGYQGSVQTNAQSQSSFPTPPSYNPMLVCQICDKKGHSALHCFQRGCQLCNRVGHTAATCFDRGASNMSMAQPMYQSHQFQAPAPVPQYQSPQFQAPVPVQQMNPSYVQHQNMSQQHPPSPVAFTAQTNFSPSAPSQEYWLLDSGATNHMTSDLSCLQAPTPYPSTETVTGANGEGQGHQQGSLSRTE